MRRGLLLVGFGLGGLALALGLTLAAFALTGDDLGTPGNAIVTPSASGHDRTETPSPRSEATPSARPSASASDDHGGHGAEPGDDHGGSGSDDSGSGSSGSGSDDSSGSGSDSSGSGSDHSGDDD